MQFLNYVIPATNFIDLDLDVLTYTSTLTDGTALPTWITFNQIVPLSYTGQPTGTERGIYNIKLTADDGYGGTVTKTFVLTVPNTPP